MKCIKCGFENPNGNVFCSNCGNKLDNTNQVNNNVNTNNSKKNNFGKVIAILNIILFIINLLFIANESRYWIDGSNIAGWGFILGLIFFIPIFLTSLFLLIVYIIYYQKNKRSIKSKLLKITNVLCFIHLIICLIEGVFFYSLFNHDDYRNNNKKANDNEIIEKTTIAQNDNNINYCDVKKITIEGSTDAEKLLNGLEGWTVGGWNYASLGNVDSSNLDDSIKINAALYNLGYFENDVYYTISNNIDGCILSKEDLDEMIKSLFKDSNYSMDEYSGFECVNLSFNYDNNNGYVNVKTTNEGGCGSSGSYLEEIYDEVKTDDKITFKIKVLYGSYDGIEYLDSSNKFVLIQNSSDTMYNEALDKYSDYANIYEWTFIKNNDGNYTFDKIIKLK